MKLIDFIKIHFESMKQDQKDNFVYGLGVRIYLISEYNFDDYTPIEYVSESIKNNMNFQQFILIKNRFNLNKQAKKILDGDFKFEHLIPKKYIIEKFNQCITPDEFEKVIRENLIHAFITIEEDNRLSSFKGRNSYELALNEYKRAGIKIERFHFSLQKNEKLSQEKTDNNKIILPMQHIITNTRTTQERLYTIRHIIDYITDYNSRKTLIELVNRIFEVGGTDFILKPLENPCDFGFFSGTRRFVFFVCRRSFFHVNIYG